MKIYATISAAAAAATFASSASAQISYVTQAGTAHALSFGCDQNYVAPASGSWHQEVVCGTGTATSQASTTGTLTSDHVIVAVFVNNGSRFGASARADVVFDLTVAAAFTYHADGYTSANFSLSGPGVSIPGVATTSGVLQPGRYTLTCNANSFGGGFGANCDLQLFAPGFLIPWSTLDGGGGTIVGGPFALSGTIGQFDAAIPILNAGLFSVTSGYWARDPGAPPCVADVDDGSSTGTPDGGVTIDDLLYYISLFGDGSASADVDDGSGSGTPDGGVTIDDLLYYLQHFEAGC